MQNDSAAVKEEINSLDKNIVVLGVDKGGTRTDTSIKDYPELRLDEDNVVVLCRTCNLQVGDSSVVGW